MQWNSLAIRRLIDTALHEDSAFEDITTQTLIPSHLKIEAKIRAKEAGVVCGLPFAVACFKRLDSKAHVILHVKEGQAVQPRTPLLTVRAKARAILSGERTALNAIQHLSGIASYTRKQVRQLGPGRAAIYDTRKTLPGWRLLQKYAVQCGDGKNHRMSLKESVLIKDNHLMICRRIRTNWMEAIRHLRKQRPSLTVEMEIQTNRDVLDALMLKPQQVLLDNMPPPKLRKVIQQLRPRIPGLEIEVSGGIRTEQLPGLRRMGVERISMGRLTHSAPSFDCALDITHVFHPR